MINSVECFLKVKKYSYCAVTTVQSIIQRLSSKVIRAMKVECIFRKPNWNLFSILCLFRNSNNLWYINRSNILENMDNKEIGR